jgi:hypothetical protein
MNERQARLAARAAVPRVGRTVVSCRGCGQDRWYGYGLCQRCDEPGPANDKIKALEPHQHCTLGVGCDEAGVCYAAAHGQPDQCGRHACDARAITGQVEDGEGRT